MSAVIFLRKHEKFVLDGEAYLALIDIDVLRHNNLDELCRYFHAVAWVELHEVLHHQRALVALWCGAMSFKPFNNHTFGKSCDFVWCALFPAACFFAFSHTSVKR